MVRALVTGASGLLGPYMAEALSSLACVSTLSGPRAGGPDLTEPHTVARVLDESRPDVIVHLVALTDVDRCETEPALARRLNVETVQLLAEHMPAPCTLVLVSTDQVYPDSAGPHREPVTGPVNQYGSTKLAGEALAEGVRALIVRTNFFATSRSKGRSSLSDFVIDNLASGRKISLFADVRFSPLHASTLSRAVASALKSGLRGTYNVGSRDGMSKLAFGRAIADLKELRSELILESDSNDTAGRAPRPHDLRLDVSRFEAAMGDVMPSLEHELRLL